MSVDTSFLPLTVCPQLLLALKSEFPSDAILRRNGTYRLTQHQEQELNALFERFGLTSRVDDPRFRDLTELAQLWGRFSIYFGKFIRYAHEAPYLYVTLTQDWPERYREYLMAVLAGDVQTASNLNKELALENLSKKLPLSE